MPQLGRWSKKSSGLVLILHKEARAGKWEARVQDLLAEVVRTQPPDAELSAHYPWCSLTSLLRGDLKAHEEKGICLPCIARVRGGSCSPGRGVPSHTAHMPSLLHVP